MDKISKLIEEYKKELAKKEAAIAYLKEFNNSDTVKQAQYSVEFFEKFIADLEKIRD